MSCQELQEEEVEVLKSIYDGDVCFKEINNTTYQYKVGDDGGYKSFLVEVVWGENYPEELPSINLDAFYNKHILDSVKESTVQQLKSEVEDFIGSAMTFTVFEFAKENADTLMAEQPDAPPQVTSENKENQQNGEEAGGEEGGKVKVRKEQLTKAQKRKLYSRLDNKGELPRGHDWVDIVRHLSQTGGHT